MGCLIVWCDEDSAHEGLHTNYKLSADDENVVFADTSLEVINLVEYPATVIEQSWAKNQTVRGISNGRFQLLTSRTISPLELISHSLILILSL